MKNLAHRLASVLLIAVAIAAVAIPASASDRNGRSYNLHTLDYRVAESLVWEICDRNGGKSENCRVQHAGPHSMNVFASQEVHAQIARMLEERDLREPASLMFEIVLVRLVDNGSAVRTGLAAHQAKALEAIKEIFPGKRAEIIDTGLISTVSEGQTRLGTDEDGLYYVTLRIRSTVGGRDGLEFTVELDIIREIEGGESRVLASTLSLADGETVVAGSSRVRGEEAMVVLLTSRSNS